MKKKLFVALLIISLLLPITSMVGAEPSVNALVPEESSILSDKLITFAKEYIDLQCQTLTTLELDEQQFERFFNLEQSESKDSFIKDTMALKARIGHYRVQPIDLRFSKYENEYTVQDSFAGKSSTKITLLRTHIGWFHDGREPERGFNVPHTFTFAEKDGKWYITSHETSDDFLVALEGIIAEKKPTAGVAVMSTDWDSAVQELIADSTAFIAQMQLEKQLIQENKFDGYVDRDKLLQNAMSTVTPQEFSFIPYNRDAAANYAIAYAPLDYNAPPYYYYTLDCTNFTSICLRYGGIVEDETGGYRWYWHSTTDTTANFTSARYFRDYYQNNVGSPSIKGLYSINGYFSGLQKGDIVQLYSKDSADAKHSMFVLYKANHSGYDDYYIAQHTGNGFYWLMTKPNYFYYRFILGSYS